MSRFRSPRDLARIAAAGRIRALLDRVAVLPGDAPRVADRWDQIEQLCAEHDLHLVRCRSRYVICAGGIE